jgi:hypothetical protein
MRFTCEDREREDLSHRLEHCPSAEEVRDLESVAVLAVEEDVLGPPDLRHRPSAGGRPQRQAKSRPILRARGKCRARGGEVAAGHGVEHFGHLRPRR